MFRTAFAGLRSYCAAALIAATCLFVGLPSVAFASCIPTQDDFAAYEADGTLEQRQAYMENLGNDSFDSNLVQSLKERQGSSNARSLRSWVPSAWASGMPLQGTAKVLAIRVAFPAEGDQPAMGFKDGDSLEALQAMFNGSAGEAPYENLNAYYTRSSYGALKFDGKAYDYTAQHCRNYYTNNVDGLFYEAVSALAKQGVDVASFDGNGDTMIDGVYIHFGGETTGWGTTWWSNERHAQNTQEIEGTGVSLGNEVLLHEPSDDSETVRTVIHETGHCLGLPDYYPYRSSSVAVSSGINTYDMMYNNVGDQCALSKWILGWIPDSAITRIKVSSDGVLVKRGNEEPQHYDGSVSEVLKSMDLNDSETGGFVAVAGDKTSCTDGKSFDIFDDDGLLSSFYLLQYDTKTANQNISQVPDGGALRVYRVQAELNDEGTDFQKANAYNPDDDKFIEALTLSNTDFHQMEQGASVTPSTTPSTNFFENLGLGFTGISLEYGQDENGQDTATVSYAASTPVDPSGFSAKLVDDSAVQCIDERELSFSMPVSYYEDPNLDPLIEFGEYPIIARLSNDGGVFRVSWSLDPTEFAPGTKADLVLPKGLFVLGRDSSGPVYSPEVRIPLTVGGDGELVPETTGAYPSTAIPGEQLREPISNALTLSDGTKVFFQGRAFNSAFEGEGPYPDDCLLVNRVSASDVAQCSTACIQGTGDGRWLSSHSVYGQSNAVFEAKLLDDNTAVLSLQGSNDAPKWYAWIDLTRDKLIAETDTEAFNPVLLSCGGSLVEAQRYSAGVMLKKFDVKSDGDLQTSYSLISSADGAMDAGNSNCAVYRGNNGDTPGYRVKVLSQDMLSALDFYGNVDDAFNNSLSFSNIDGMCDFAAEDAAAIDAIAVTGNSIVMASREIDSSAVGAAPLVSCLTRCSFDGNVLSKCQFANRIDSESAKVRLLTGESGNVVACLYPDFLTSRSMEQACELAFFDSDLTTVKYGVSYCGPSGFWNGTKFVSVGLSSLNSSWDKTDQVRYDIYQGLSAGTDPVGPDNLNPGPGTEPGSGSDGGAGSDSGANATAPSVSAKTGDSAVGLVAVLTALCSGAVAVSAKKRRRAKHK